MLGLDSVIFLGTHSLSLNKSRPAAVRISCDWFVSSVYMSAHIFRACAVSGINSVCVRLSVPVQFGSPLCLLLCNAEAPSSFPCSLHPTQSSALCYTCRHALQQQNAIYRPAPQGQIRLLIGKNKFTFSHSYLGRSQLALLKDERAEGRKKKCIEEIARSEMRREQGG